MSGYTVREVSLLKYFDKEIPFNHLPNYFTNIYFLDVEKLREEFINKKLLTYTNLEETISFYTVAQMKTFCKENSIDIKLSGKKDDLIKRLLENVDHSILEDYFNVKRYKLTAIGNLLVSKHHDNLVRLNKTQHFDFLEHNPEFFEFIENHEYNKVYDKWCNKGYFGNKNASIDTCLKFYNDKSIFLQSYRASEKLIKNIIILNHITWIGIESVPVILEYSFHLDIPIEILQQVKNELHSYYSLKTYQEELARGYALTYSIYNIDDLKACDYCKQITQKEFPIKQAKIGINFPPLLNCTCGVCRCHTQINYLVEDIFKRLNIT